MEPYAEIPVGQTGVAGGLTGTCLEEAECKLAVAGDELLATGDRLAYDQSATICSCSSAHGGAILQGEDKPKHYVCRRKHGDLRDGAERRRDEESRTNGLMHLLYAL